MKPPSALTNRSVSARRGKGKYTLAPMEHRKTPGVLPPPSINDVLVQNAMTPVNNSNPAVHYGTHSSNTPKPGRSSMKRPGSLNPLPPLSSSSRAMQPVASAASLNPYGVISRQGASQS